MFDVCHILQGVMLKMIKRSFRFVICAVLQFHGILPYVKNEINKHAIYL